MITSFTLLAERCGLSHREAAEFHGVRLDTAKSWSAGRNNAPDGVIADLRDLYTKIERAAAGEAVKIINDKAGGTEAVELGIATDDAEAQTLGWPCVGAHGAVLGLIAARVPNKIIIVPRGSTQATAAAADAHDK